MSPTQREIPHLVPSMEVLPRCLFWLDSQLQKPIASAIFVHALSLRNSLDILLSLKSDPKI